MMKLNHGPDGGLRTGNCSANSVRKIAKLGTIQAAILSTREEYQRLILDARKEAS